MITDNITKVKNIDKDKRIIALSISIFLRFVFGAIGLFLSFRVNDFIYEYLAIPCSTRILLCILFFVVCEIVVFAIHIPETNGYWEYISPFFEKVRKTFLWIFVIVFFFLPSWFFLADIYTNNFMHKSILIAYYYSINSKFMNSFDEQIDVLNELLILTEFDEKYVAERGKVYLEEAQREDVLNKKNQTNEESSRRLYENAEKDLMDALEKNDENPEYNYNLAKVYLYKDDPNYFSARKLIEKAIEKDEGIPKYHYLYSKILFELAKSTDKNKEYLVSSLDEIELSIKLYNDINEDCYFFPEKNMSDKTLSEYYFQKGSIDYYVADKEKTNIIAINEAIENFTKAIELDNSNPELYYNLGCANVLKQDYDYYNVALDNFDKAIELKSVEQDFSDLNIIYAWEGFVLQYKIGTKDEEDFKKAIDCYKRSIKESSDYCYSYHNLGLLYEEHEQYSNAIEVYNIAFENCPDSYDGLLYYERGQNYYNMGNLDAAIADLSSALEYEDYWIESCQILADVYFEAENYEYAHYYYDYLFNYGYETDYNMQMKETCQTKIEEL